MKIIPHEKFIFAVERFKLLEKKDKVLVALSGGPDSTACLLNLKGLQKERDLEIHALYIDHGLREDTEKDKEFIENLCKKLNIHFHFEKITLIKRKNIEEIAREKRKKIFEEYVKKYGFNKIATGHTLDDIIETLLFRTVRGGFGEKIIGILPKDGFYVRPLILLTKEENKAFLSSVGINYRIDITNYSFDITRNYIRHRIIPLFHDIFPEWQKGFIKTYISFVEEREFIKRHVEEIYTKNLFMETENFIVLNYIPKISEYELKELVTYLFQKIRKDKPLSFYQKEEIKKIYEKKGGRVTLSKNVFFEVSAGFFSIFKETGLRKKMKIKKGILKWDAMGIKIKINRKMDGFLRNWEEGDYMILNKRRKKVKKIFNEKKIPRFLRKYLPLIAREKEVLWIYPDLFSDEFKREKNVIEIIK